MAFKKQPCGQFKTQQQLLCSMPHACISAMHRRLLKGQLALVNLYMHMCTLECELTHSVSKSCSTRIEAVKNNPRGCMCPAPANNCASRGKHAGSCILLPACLAAAFSCQQIGSAASCIDLHVLQQTLLCESLTQASALCLFSHAPTISQQALLACLEEAP